MKIPCSEKLKTLCKNLGQSIYIVGGYVRNYLIDQSISKDVDLAGVFDSQTIIKATEQVGGQVLATYKRTGTVVFKLEDQKYEYTTFREDGYTAGGKHLPEQVVWTDDIKKDALRRDFRCNAVYYDLLKEQLIDPLDGVKDIKNKVLQTVKSADEVFSHDGLRLLRLARFSGELAFSITDEVERGARKNASNILDISKERIYSELKAILICDKKYSFSDKYGHYNALKVLERCNVLSKILPQLTLGRGMAQRQDFHKYDVLEHSLRCVKYADESVRLGALLHDVGKPYCMEKFGKYHGHDKVGADIALSILKELKADNKTTTKTVRLIKNHMLDMDLMMKEQKVRLFIAKNQDIFKPLLLLKQADYSACKDDFNQCKTVEKWNKIYDKMIKENTPLCLKDLKVCAKDLLEIGVQQTQLSQALSYLFEECVKNPALNKKDKLLDLATKRLLNKPKRK